MRRSRRAPAVRARPPTRRARVPAGTVRPRPDRDALPSPCSRPRRGGRPRRTRPSARRRRRCARGARPRPGRPTVGSRRLRRRSGIPRTARPRDARHGRAARSSVPRSPRRRTESVLWKQSVCPATTNPYAPSGSGKLDTISGSGVVRTATSRASTLQSCLHVSSTVCKRSPSAATTKPGTLPIAFSSPVAGSIRTASWRRSGRADSSDPACRACVKTIDAPSATRPVIAPPRTRTPRPTRPVVRSMRQRPSVREPLPTVRASPSGTPCSASQPSRVSAASPTIGCAARKLTPGVIRPGAAIGSPNGNVGTTNPPQPRPMRPDTEGGVVAKATTYAERPFSSQPSTAALVPYANSFSGHIGSSTPPRLARAPFPTSSSSRSSSSRATSTMFSATVTCPRSVSVARSATTTCSVPSATTSSSRSNARCPIPRIGTVPRIVTADGVRSRTASPSATGTSTRSLSTVNPLRSHRASDQLAPSPTRERRNGFVGSATSNSETTGPLPKAGSKPSVTSRSPSATICVAKPGTCSSPATNG